VLYRELDRWVGDRNRQPAPRTDTGSRVTQNAQPPRGPAQHQPNKDAPVVERDILKLILENQADMTGFIFSYITVEDIADPQLKKIVELLLARIDELGPGNVTEFVDEIDDPALKGIVTDIVMSKYELSKKWERGEVEFEEVDPWRVARDAIVAMKKRKLQTQIEVNMRAVKETAVHGGDSQLLLRLHQDLMQQLHDVESGAIFKTN
jgi:hypothetical protein